MAIDEALIDWAREALEPIGALSWRPMMGGATLYLDGTVFAIVADDRLWLKADKVSDARWDEAGCARFAYEFGEGRTGSMNYRAAPDAIYGDAEAFREWAALALEAGRRAPVKRKKTRD